MKIFLTGGSGLLGRAFVATLKARDIEFIAPSSSTLDLCDPAQVKTFMTTEKPDLIIHCAAYTAVDLAESEQDKCWAVNVSALEHLITYNVPIVHFSTDYVFDAFLKKDGHFFVITPDYPRAPLNFYGESKVAAEEVLENSDIDWWNIRTTWLYGPDGEGFPEKIKKRAERDEQIAVVNDQYGRKTLTTDLAQFVMDEVLDSQPKKSLHYQSEGPIHTWYDWACELLPDTEITPVSAAEMNFAAKRPENSILL